MLYSKTDTHIIKNKGVTQCVSGHNKSNHSITLLPNTEYLILEYAELDSIAIDSVMNLGIYYSGNPEAFGCGVTRNILDGGGGQVWWGYIHTGDESITATPTMHVPSTLGVRTSIIAISLP